MAVTAPVGMPMLRSTTPEYEGRCHLARNVVMFPYVGAYISRKSSRLRLMKSPERMDPPRISSLIGRSEF